MGSLSRFTFQTQYSYGSTFPAEGNKKYKQISANDEALQQGTLKIRHRNIYLKYTVPKYKVPKYKVL